MTTLMAIAFTALAWGSGFIVGVALTRRRLYVPASVINTRVEAAVMAALIERDLQEQEPPPEHGRRYMNVVSIDYQRGEKA